MSGMFEGSRWGSEERDLTNTTQWPVAKLVKGSKWEQTLFHLSPGSSAPKNTSTGPVFTKLLGQNVLYKSVFAQGRERTLQESEICN